MPPPRRRREPLSCPVIADAAVRLADERGVEALTMRTLAASLGVEAMSLYSHFASKDALLDAITSRILDDLALPPRGAAPRTRLRAVAVEFRRIGHRHPNIFPLIVLRPQRLSAALRPTEAALDALLEAGLPPRRAIRAQRLLLGFVRGFTLWEIGGFATGRRPGPGARPRASVLAELHALDAARFPRIVEHAELLVDFDPDRQFHACVESLLDSILPDAASARRRERTGSRVA